MIGFFTKLHTKTFSKNQGFISFVPSPYFIAESSASITITYDSNSYKVDPTYYVENLQTVTSSSQYVQALTYDYDINVYSNPIDSPSTFIVPSNILD